MKVWGISKKSKAIEFISYSSQYRDEVLAVIKQAFYPHETVCKASEVSLNAEAVIELQAVCDDVLSKSGTTIVARDVEKNKLVGVALNLIKVNTTTEQNYFRKMRDLQCKTEPALSMMNYMILSDTRIDLFEKFNVNSLLEVLFLMVLPEYNGVGVGIELVNYSVKLAEYLKHGQDSEKYLAFGEPAPQLVAAIWTGRGSQSIGQKLGFEVIFKEPMANFLYKGRNFAERVGDFSLEHQVTIKRI